MSAPLETVKFMLRLGQFDIVNNTLKEVVNNYSSNIGTEFNSLYAEHTKFTSMVESDNIKYEDISKNLKQFEEKYEDLISRMELETSSSSKRKILFFSANPKDQDYLVKLEDEKDNIWLSYLEWKVSKKKENEFDFQVSTGSTVRHFVRDFQSYKPNILHFAGHSNGYGIVLMNREGNSKTVKTEYLCDFFKNGKEHLDCIVFNSCLSAFLGQDISKLVGNVVAMKAIMPDKTALVFARDFYISLFNGSSIKEAFLDGKASIGMEQLPGIEIPTLFINGVEINS